MITDSIVAVDFDGTIVSHEYPKIGFPVPGAIASLRKLLRQGNKLILWTMRSGEQLEAAVQYLERNGIPLYGINGNPSQHTWTSSPKAYAHHYIDDAALGVPLIYPEIGRPYVDWSKLEL